MKYVWTNSFNICNVLKFKNKFYILLQICIKTFLLINKQMDRDMDLYLLV